VTPRQAELGVDLFTGAVIASVAIALAGLTWRLSGDSGDAAHVAAVPLARPPVQIDVSPILALAPFGRTVTAATATSPTALGLELRGIVLAIPRAASTALIGTSGGPTRAWVIGQALDGGAVIQDIAIDHVVLSVNGQAQVLAFPNATPPTLPPPPPVPAAPMAIAPGVPPVNLSTPVPVAPPPQVPPPPPSRPASQAFLDSMGATPTGSGYRIGPNISGAMRQAGLQPGDMIEKVNGTNVGDVERDRRLFDAAAQAGVARVEVVRDGTRVTLAFPLR
jgi:general secretion pathway protein C